MSKKPAKRQPITQEEIDVYRPLETRDNERVPNNIATAESRRIAVEDAIAAFSENVRWNAALGKPLNEELAFIQKALPHIKAGAGTSKGGKKGGKTRAAQLKNAPNTLKTKILAAAEAYKGDKRKRASAIATQLRITGDASYVRTVLREAGL